MDDDGGWLDPAGLAEPRLQPKTQVVVFLAIDENRIEAMQCGEILGADRKAGAADHRQRARLAKVRRIARKAAVEFVGDVAPLADDGAEGLDGAVRKQQLGLDCADRGVVERRRQRAQPPGLNARVIVEEHHDAARADREAEIAAEREIQVLPVAHQPRVRVARDAAVKQSCRCGIAAVIDQDELELATCLGLVERCKAGGGELRLAVNRDHNRHQISVARRPRSIAMQANPDGACRARCRSS